MPSSVSCPHRRIFRVAAIPCVRFAGAQLLVILILVGLAGLGCRNAWGSDVPPSGVRPVPAVASEAFRTAAALREGGPAALTESNLTSLERRLFADAADSRLDEFSLLTASLVASGIDSPEVLVRYQKQLDALVAELSQTHPEMRHNPDGVKRLFDFLHRRVLSGGYRIECTDLRTTLEQGQFNCVSASVLFQCLAERQGLDVCGLEMPGHAMSRVRLPDTTLDIETTCSAWFRLMDDPKRQAQSVRDTLGTSHGNARALAREISGIGLVAMVYYNRGVDLLAAARYADAAAANAKALRLDGDSQTARGNLLATINNWAIALGQAGQLDEAVAVLEAGLAVDPHYRPFALNYAHVCNQRDRQQAIGTIPPERSIGATLPAPAGP